MPSNLDTLRALHEAIVEDARLQKMADSYDDDYDSDPLPVSVVVDCGRARETLLRTALTAAPQLALLLRLADAVKARRDAEAEMDDSVLWQAASDRLRLAIEQTNAILAELEAQ